MFSESVKAETFEIDNTWHNIDSFTPPSNYEEIIINIMLASGNRLSIRAMKFEVDGIPNGGGLFNQGCFLSGSVNNVGSYLAKGAQGLKPIIFENGVQTTSSCKMKVNYRYR